MKVLYLSPSASLGGAERVLLSMLTELRRVDAHVLTLGEGPLNRLLAARGVAATALRLPVSLERLGDSQCGSIGLTRKIALLRQSLLALPGLGQVLTGLRLVVRRVRPDLIHSNGIKTHLLARLAGIDVPTLWHVHDFYGSRPLASRLLGCGSGRMRGAIAVSRAVAEDFRKIVRGAQVRVIANAVDVERFRPCDAGAADLDRLAGLTTAHADTVRVGLVATYARWKGHDLFLKAAAELLRSDSDAHVRFYLVGGPVYRTDGSQFREEELRAAVQALGLTAHVGFVGFRERPEEVYPALDVVVHASTRPEPFGLTIVEAMACGRAVIATQAGGAAEIIDHGCNALGVPPGDAPALAMALRSLLRDADLRGRLGREARHDVLQRFDQRRLGAQLEAVYRQALAGKSSPPGLDYENEVSKPSSRYTQAGFTMIS